MRIRNIQIRGWRHFENIALELPDDAPLVCIVGANGTGKSHLLELIAACAQRLGLSQGVEIPRGDPFNDAHDLSLQFFMAQGVSEAVENVAAEPAAAGWDRTLTITSQRSPTIQFTRIEAGGLAEPHNADVAGRVVDELRRSQSVHFLSLDADRAYPKR